MSAGAASWPRVKLGEVLRHIARPLTVEVDGTYREIGIRSHGKGLFHKAPIVGAALGDKRVFYIEPGDFVLNIVFAWEGAIGVVSEAERGMIASHRFPCFRAVKGHVDLRFLERFFHTHAGRELLGRVSPGGAGRNRTLNRTAFMQQEIPLPPLPEQQRIVARIDGLADEVSIARRLGTASDLTSSGVMAAALNRLLAHQSDWPSTALETFATVRSGVTLGRSLQGETLSLPYLRVANVQDGWLDLASVKTVDVLASEEVKWRLQPGDLLMTEGGDWDKLGRCAIWAGEIANCIHQNHVFCVRPDPARVLPEYLAAYVGSPVGKAYFQSCAKQTTNLASINQRQLRAFPVTVPSLEAQAKLVHRLAELRREVSVLHDVQKQARVRVDALLPAILDRAFAGAL